MIQSNDVLLDRAVRGDKDALSALLELYGPRVRRELRIDPAWRSLVDADDIMQVSYIEVFLRIREFAPSSADAFGSWLKRIAENNLRDAIRALNRRKRRPPGVRLMPHDPHHAWQSLLELLSAATGTPSKSVARHQANAALESAIALLPPDYSTVVRQYDLAGRAMGDVAGAMGRSVGAAFMLRARAHDRLRETLGSESQFF